MELALAGMKGAFCYLDDILIFAQSEEEHDRILTAVLRWLQEVGLK